MTLQDFFGEVHPGVQLLYFGIVILVSIFFPHPLVLGCSFVGALCYNIRLRGWRRVARQQILYFLPAMAVVIGINGAFSHYGVTPLYYLKTGAVTLEALVYGAVLGWMLWTSILWFAAVNQVMTMDRWVYLLGRCAPALSLALAVTLRFVPRCGRQMQKIQEGGRCLRGGRRLSSPGGVKVRGAQFSALLTWALESGAQMADSMRARGYGAARRTAYRRYLPGSSDRILLAGMAALALGSLLGFFLGFAGAVYDPAIQIAGMGEPGSAAVYGCWGVYCLLPAVLGSAGRIRQNRWERTYRKAGE